MDSKLPGIPERLDLLDLARGILDLSVFDISLARRNLPVGAELDPVWRVHVDHLDLAAERLTLGEAGHHVERVAEDHSVRPVRVVPIELDQIELVEAVEGLEQGQLRLVLGSRGGIAQVLDEDAGIDLLLDIDRRGFGD